MPMVSMKMPSLLKLEAGQSVDIAGKGKVTEVRKVDKVKGKDASVEIQIEMVDVTTGSEQDQFYEEFEKQASKT